MTTDVLIPAHDAADDIERAVRSALDQPDVSEVIVVADRCTDDTARVASGAGARVIEADCGSPAGARNRGLRACRAEWIALLDADDALAPGWLAAAHETAERTGAGLVCGRVTDVYPRADGSTLEVPRTPPPSGVKVADLLRRNVITTSTVVADRALLLKLGGFDERYYGPEDWDLWLRVAAERPIAGSAHDAVRYHHTPGSIVRSASSVRRLNADQRRVLLAALDRHPELAHLTREARARVDLDCATRLIAIGERAEALACLRQAPWSAERAELEVAARLPASALDSLRWSRRELRRLAQNHLQS